MKTITITRNIAAALQRLTAYGLILSQVLLSLVWVPPALAQAVDPEPPVISLERQVEGRRGDNQVFTATISDNVGVESATLRYRFGADQPYRSLPMTPIGSTSIHTASVDTESGNSEIIQYYIEANDAAGNRTIEGFAFDPIERRLIAGSVANSGDSNDAGVLGSLSTGQKVLYGVLGTVLIGALVVAAGGDDSGSSNQGSPGPDVPVSITIEDLEP